MFQMFQHSKLPYYHASCHVHKNKYLLIHFLFRTILKVRSCSRDNTSHKNGHFSILALILQLMTMLPCLAVYFIFLLLTRYTHLTHMLNKIKICNWPTQQSAPEAQQNITKGNWLFSPFPLYSTWASSSVDFFMAHNKNPKWAIYQHHHIITLNIYIASFLCCIAFSLFFSSNIRPKPKPTKKKARPCHN